MRYQTNGLEFTYQEALFIKREIQEKELRLSNAELAVHLQNMKGLLLKYDAGMLPVVFMGMTPGEYEDFCQFAFVLKQSEKIPIMEPYYGKNANVIYVIPRHESYCSDTRQ